MDRYEEQGTRPPDPFEDVVNLADLPGAILEIDEYAVREWHPEPDGKGRPEAVAVTFSIKGVDDVSFALRLKSKRSVNELIAALRRHRDSVWP